MWTLEVGVAGHLGARRQRGVDPGGAGRVGEALEALREPGCSQRLEVGIGAVGDHAVGGNEARLSGFSGLVSPQHLHRLPGGILRLPRNRGSSPPTALPRKAVISCLYMLQHLDDRVEMGQVGAEPPTLPPSRARSGVRSSLSSRRSAGKPVGDALIAPRRPSKNALRSGAAFPAATSVGLSCARRGPQLLHERVGVAARSCRAGSRVSA